MTKEITVSKGVMASGESLCVGRVHSVSDNDAKILIKKGVASLHIGYVPDEEKERFDKLYKPKEKPKNQKRNK